MSSIDLKQALEDAMEVITFETWVRHYFLVQRDGKLFVDIPEDVMADVQSKHPHVAGLAAVMNKDFIDQEISQRTVCSFIAARLDGTRYEANLMSHVFDHRNFKIESYVFNVWLRMHEQFLDEERKSFEEWREMYENWRKMEQVAEYVAKLYSGNMPMEGEACRTVH